MPTMCMMLKQKVTSIVSNKPPEPHVTSPLPPTPHPQSLLHLAVWPHYGLLSEPLVDLAYITNTNIFLIRDLAFFKYD